MGIQSRVGNDAAAAPPAGGRRAAKVATLLSVAGNASTAQTASVAKELLQKSIVGRADDEAATPSDEDQS